MAPKTRSRTQRTTHSRHQSPPTAQPKRHRVQRAQPLRTLPVRRAQLPRAYDGKVSPAPNRPAIQKRKTPSTSPTPYPNLIMSLREAKAGFRKPERDPSPPLRRASIPCAGADTSPTPSPSRFGTWASPSAVTPTMGAYPAAATPEFNVRRGELFKDPVDEGLKASSNPMLGEVLEMATELQIEIEEAARKAANTCRRVQAAARYLMVIGAAPRE